MNNGSILVTTVASSDGSLVRSSEWGPNGGAINPGTYTLSFTTTRKSGLALPVVAVWFYDTPGNILSNPTITGSESGGRARYTVTAPANTKWVVFQLTSQTQSNASGDWYRISNTMLTAGTATYPYADGDSAGWIWNGTANASSSTGPVN